MKLFNGIKDYITDENEFNESLAVEIVNYQLENNEIYKEFSRKRGIREVKSISEIPFMPVELFKSHKIFSFGSPEGVFISSGTTGAKSKVYYNKKTLELYRSSALISYPFKDKTIYSLIPPVEISKNSSLARMIGFFSEEIEVKYLNPDSFDINPNDMLKKIINNIEENSVIFLTSVQLLHILNNSKTIVEKKLFFIETGGYKAINKKYLRKELYDYGKKIFINSDFYSEYGMAELFSQFYTISPNNNYIFNHYNRVLSGNGKNLLKVFDFANLGTVSALLVPDLIDKKGKEFDVLGRIGSEIRGCGYVFK